MRWFDRSNKTHRISTLETAIARLASEVAGLKRIAEKTQAGVEGIQKAMNANHVAHARCETLQNGRWEMHDAAHETLGRDLAELTQLVRKNAENIRILSATVSRIADRQRRIE